MEREALTDLKERARRAYERGRARHAAWTATPTLAVGLVATWMSDRPLITALIGVALYAAAALLSWRGRQLGRGVLPGVAAGLVPFTAAHAARVYGHLCTPEGCVSICVPACLAGGIAAGALLAGALRRSDRLGASWASACGVAALTGALACACVGFGGVLALAIGLLAGTAPLALRPARGGA